MEISLILISRPNLKPIFLFGTIVNILSYPTKQRKLGQSSSSKWFSLCKFELEFWSLITQFQNLSCFFYQNLVQGKFYGLEYLLTTRGFHPYKKWGENLVWSEKLIVWEKRVIKELKCIMVTTLLAFLLASCFCVEIKLGNLMIWLKILNLKHLKPCNFFDLKLITMLKKED